MIPRPRLIARTAAVAVAALGGVAVGVALAAREISGPQRPPFHYRFSPFEVQIPDDAYSTFQVYAADGTAISALLLESPGAERVIVGCHGHRGNRSDLLGIGPGLWRDGNHIVLFDFRGNADSADGPQSLAHYEQQDLVAVLDEVARRFPGLPIGLYGVSMGAATVLLVGSQDPRVTHICADSPFAEMAGVIAHAARARKLPPTPLLPLVDHATRLRYGYRFADVQPIDVVDDIPPRPFLLIHGTGDELIPVDHSLRIKERLGDACELWLVEGGNHCEAYFTDRTGYIARVAAFFRS